MMNDDVCATCNRVHGGDYQPQHPFRSKGSAVVLRPSEEAPSAEPRMSPFPFDPVLRQALVDKGVLTVDDLRDAEAKILVTTGHFQRAVREAIAEEVHDRGMEDVGRRST